MQVRPMARFHMVAGDERECGSVDFVAPDVAKALAIAYQLAGGATFELWEEGRRICTIHRGTRMARIGSGGGR